MKIIALPDLHGRIGQLDNIADELSTVDVVVLAGDLTNGSIAEATHVVETVKKHNTLILTIPGNMDSNEILHYTVQAGINIHRGNRTINGIAFTGVGGALPFAGPFVFSETEFETIFDEMVMSLDSDRHQILICHQPPLNTRNDKLPTGVHVGSQAVRKFIEIYQPLICFTGHIHEAQGIDTIGETKIINPGPLWQGGYAYAEVDDGQITKLEIRTIADTTR